MKQAVTLFVMAVASVFLVANAPIAQASNDIVANPTVTIVDGVIRGVLNSGSLSDATLKYESLGGNFGGKLEIGPAYPYQPADPLEFVALPYATWLDGGAKGTERFSVRISDVAHPDTNFLVVHIDVDVAALAPGDTPVSYTYKVVSFNGTKISTNFFPASGLADGDTANTVLVAPGDSLIGATNPFGALYEQELVAGAGAWRQYGYNVVSWDSRGAGESGGRFHFSSPFYEARDVSELISWISNYTPATLNGPLDPAIGMVGSGYGGSLALVTASTDPRIDAIVPTNAWHSFGSAMLPNQIYKSRVGRRILRALADDGVRLDRNVREGLETGNRTGVLPVTTRALISSTGPSVLLQQLQAPTLIVNEGDDPFVGLSESANNAVKIMSNPFGTPVKVAWTNTFNHGDEALIVTVLSNAVAWMDTYVAGSSLSANLIPNFQWWDQQHTVHQSSLYPWDELFNVSESISATGTGGNLTIIKGLDAPVTVVRTPIRIAVGREIAGVPTVTFTYRGTGDARAVFARLVDKHTHKVIGRKAIAVPVILDGQSHTVSVALDYVLYVSDSSDATHLALQVRSADRSFAPKFSGTLEVSDIQIHIPWND